MRLIGLAVLLTFGLFQAQQTGKVLVYWLCRECGSAS
jgi:hypothetical protein